MVKGRTHTQRTLAALREQGFMVDIVERRYPSRPWLPHGKTHDMFGFIDILAVDHQVTLGVQSCAGSTFAAHRRKILESCYDRCRAWLACPNRKLEIWGWRKVKVKRGGTAMRWAPRVEEITLEQLRSYAPISETSRSDISETADGGGREVDDL